MQPPKQAILSETHLHIRARGESEFLPKDFSGAVKDDGMIHWDPGVDGVICGESTMLASSDHGGERHLDGEEVLYLISGRMRLLLEPDDSEPVEISLKAGEAVLVPRGVWHRLEVDEPSRFLFIGGGRTDIRLPPAG